MRFQNKGTIYSIEQTCIKKYLFLSYMCETHDNHLKVKPYYILCLIIIKQSIYHPSYMQRKSNIFLSLIQVLMVLSKFFTAYDIN
jgi:hypothetical protein